MGSSAVSCSRAVHMDHLLKDKGFLQFDASNMIYGPMQWGPVRAVARKVYDAQEKRYIDDSAKNRPVGPLPDPPERPPQRRGRRLDLRHEFIVEDRERPDVRDGAGFALPCARREREARPSP